MDRQSQLGGALHEKTKSMLSSDVEKLAYESGAALASYLTRTGEFSDPTQREGDRSITGEDVLRVLWQLVEAGEMNPLQAQQIIKKLINQRKNEPPLDKESLDAEVQRIRAMAQAAAEMVESEKVKKAP